MRHGEEDSVSTKADVKTVGIGEVIKKISPNDIFNCDKLIYLGG